MKTIEIYTGTDIDGKEQFPYHTETCILKAIEEAQKILQMDDGVTVCFYTNALIFMRALFYAFADIEKTRQENKIVLIKGVAFRYFVNDRLVDCLDEVVGEWNGVEDILLEDVGLEAMLEGKKKLEKAKRSPSWKTRSLKYY